VLLFYWQYSNRRFMDGMRALKADSAGGIPAGMVDQLMALQPLLIIEQVGCEVLLTAIG
jgi:hypothetical protein